MRLSGRRPIRAVATTLVVVAATVVGHAAAAAPAPGGATITVADEAFADDAIPNGATFKVVGTGWPADSLVQLEVCGAEARNGSSDCAVAQAQVVGSDASGAFRARIAVVVPPSPCPCVVRAFGQTNGQQAVTPVDVPGAPDEHPGDGEVDAPALRRLEVRDVVLRGADDLGTWFGQPARRTLVFQIANTGDVDVLEATVTLTRGDADRPTGFVQPVRIDAIAPGEQRTITVPIQFDALAFGDQAVRGTVNGTSAPVVFKATTSTHPWLLIGIPIALALQLLLLLVRNRVRHRLHVDEEITEPQGDPADRSLIVVVDLEEVDETPDGPVRRHRTEVVRDLRIVRAIVLADTSRTEHDAETNAGTAAAGDVIQAIPSDRPSDHDGDRSDVTVAARLAGLTVLADESARVGDAHRDCEQLCDWIEAAYADADDAAVRARALRRSPHGTAAAAGWGMVPLCVMVRGVAATVGAGDQVSTA